MPTEDPCTRARRLQAVREALVTGEAVTATRFGEDMVQFAKADLGALEREIRAACAECSRMLGETPKRRRHAMGARFNRY